MNNKALYEKSINALESINDNQNVDTIYRSLLYGKNSYLRLTRRGSSSIDPHWIEKIEDCLYELDQIVNKPREETKNESEVTPIELAKRLTVSQFNTLLATLNSLKKLMILAMLLLARFYPTLMLRTSIHTKISSSLHSFVD